LGDWPDHLQSSAAQRFGNLQALKRPDTQEHTERRASLQDSYGKVGVLGGLWNRYVMYSCMKSITLTCVASLAVQQDLLLRIRSRETLLPSAVKDHLQNTWTSNSGTKTDASWILDCFPGMYYRLLHLFCHCRITFSWAL
jgi:hypothetical protein